MSATSESTSRDGLVQSARERLLRSSLAKTPAAIRLRSAVRAWRAPAAATGDGPGPDMPAEFVSVYDRCAPFTMTSVERMYALYEAVRYVGAAEIPGDVVECGVWRGGSSMVAALTLAQQGLTRRLWLYDTFEGMPPPVSTTSATPASEPTSRWIRRSGWPECQTIGRGPRWTTSRPT